MRGVANRSLAERWAKWRRHHPVAMARAGALGTALLGIVAAGLIVWFTGHRRLADAMAELEQGRMHLAAGHHRQAGQSLEHGLILLESGTAFDRLLPGARETRDRLNALLERSRRADVVAQLHDLADRIRLLYATGPTRPDIARKLEHRLAEIWRARGRIERQLAGEEDEPDEGMRARIRTDLLDLAILWANLRVDLADEAGRRQAHRDALRILTQAEADWGPSPVLLQEKRFHTEAIGGREFAEAKADQPPGMSARTAWEHYALGRAFLRHGDLDAAAEELDRAVALQPQSLWAQFYRGQCALHRGRHAEAVDAFGACVALAPEAVCYYNRSLAYAGLGVKDRARLDLERAGALDASLLTGHRKSAAPTRRRHSPAPR